MAQSSEPAKSIKDETSPVVDALRRARVDDGASLREESMADIGRGNLYEGVISPRSTGGAEKGTPSKLLVAGRMRGLGPTLPPPNRRMRRVARGLAEGMAFELQALRESGPVECGTLQGPSVAEAHGGYSV